MIFALRSSSAVIDPSLVPGYVSGIFTNQCIEAALVTALVYDSIITFEKEIKYFWKSSWSTVTFVYFVNRYVGLIGAITGMVENSLKADHQLCEFVVWTTDLSYWCTIISIDYILMIRVLALYSSGGSTNKKLSVFLGALLLIEAVSKMGLLISSLLLEEITAIRLAASDAAICDGLDYSQLWIFYLNWIIPMLYGVILMVLAFSEAAEYWKESVGLKGFPLVRVLIQDQIIYFTLVVLICLAEVLVYKVTDFFWQNVLEALGDPTFLCIMGSRLLINLKEAGERGLNEGTSYRLPSVSDLEFC